MESFKKQLKTYTFLTLLKPRFSKIVKTTLSNFKMLLRHTDGIIEKTKMFLVFFDTFEFINQKHVIFITRERSDTADGKPRL